MTRTGTHSLAQPQNLAPFHVLVTSISKKVPLLREVRKALAKVDPNGRIHGADASELCVGRYFVDSFWPMPRLSDLSHEILMNYCVQHGIRCIVPTRDGELAYFAAAADRLRGKGVHCLVSPIDSITSCVDKLEFYHQGKRHGFPVIPAGLTVDDIDADLYVVKERYGAGSQSIGVHLSRQHAIEHANLMEHPIFQPYVAGQEFSVDVYVDRYGFGKGAVARTRDLVVSGESQITTTVHHAELESTVLRFAERLELYGPTVFQVILDNQGGMHIIECNSRFGGASTLSAAVGLDSFYWAFLEASNRDLGEYPFDRLSDEKKQVRYAEDLIL